MMKPGLKKVLSYEYVGACRYTGYLDKSIKLTLDCGHEMTRKASAGHPQKARCYYCERDAPRMTKSEENAILRTIMQ